MKRIRRQVLTLAVTAMVFAGLGFAAVITACAAHNDQPVARTSEFG